MYFLELFEAINSENQNQIKNLIKEANELVSITVASINTLRSKSQIKK